MDKQEIIEEIEDALDDPRFRIRMLEAKVATLITRLNEVLRRTNRPECEMIPEEDEQ